MSKRIIINTYDDLPSDVKSKLAEVDLSITQISENLNVIANIFYFKTDYHIYTPETLAKRNEAAWPMRNLEGSLVSDEIVSVKSFKEEEEELIDFDVFEENYDLREKIGSGAFGKVYRARSDIEGGSRVAIKIINHYETERQKRKNFQELRILMLCQGQQNCVNFIRAHIFDDKMWFVMEFLNGGTLSEIIEVHDFSEPEIVYIVKSILKALDFLHDLEIVHRDLKPANIMIVKSGLVKLLDFGLCSDVSPGPVVHMVGSPYWMSPEMIMRDPHSLPVDIWSLGIVILDIVRQDFHSSVESMFHGVVAGYANVLQGQERWSNHMRSFLREALHQDQYHRWTAKQLLQHSFITKNETIRQSIMKSTISRIRDLI